MATFISTVSVIVCRWCVYFWIFTFVFYSICQEGICTFTIKALFSGQWLKRYKAITIPWLLLLSNLLVHRAVVVLTFWLSLVGKYANLLPLLSFYWINLTRTYHQKARTSRVTAATTATLHLAALTLNASGCFPRLHKGDIFMFMASLSVLLYTSWEEIVIRILPLSSNLIWWTTVNWIWCYQHWCFSSLHCSVSLSVSNIIFNTP